MHERVTVNAITASRNIAGVTFPKPVIAAIERAERIKAGYGVTRPSLAATIADALADERDPATDPAVIAANTGQAVTAAERAVTEHALNELADTLSKHADDIVKAWRVPFATAAADLKAAHNVLGDVDLNDSAAVVQKGGNAADAWAKATKAVALIDKVSTAWTMLATLTGRHKSGGKLQRGRMLADLPIEAYLDDELGQTAWDLVRQGHELTLATLNEYRDRGTAARAARQRQADAIPEAARDKRRQHFGIKVGG